MSPNIHISDNPLVHESEVPTPSLPLKMNLSDTAHVLENLDVAATTTSHQKSHTTTQPTTPPTTSHSSPPPTSPHLHFIPAQIEQLKNVMKETFITRDQHD